MSLTNICSRYFDVKIKKLNREIKLSKRIDKAFYREKQVQGWSRKKKEALIKSEYGMLPDLSVAYRDKTSTSTSRASVDGSASVDKSASVGGSSKKK